MRKQSVQLVSAKMLGWTVEWKRLVHCSHVVGESIRSHCNIVILSHVMTLRVHEVNIPNIPLSLVYYLVRKSGWRTRKYFARYGTRTFNSIAKSADPFCKNAPAPIQVPFSRGGETFDEVGYRIHLQIHNRLADCVTGDKQCLCSCWAKNILCLLVFTWNLEPPEDNPKPYDWTQWRSFPVPINEGEWILQILHWKIMRRTDYS